MIMAQCRPVSYQWLVISLLLLILFSPSYAVAESIDAQVKHSSSSAAQRIVSLGLCTDRMLAYFADPNDVLALSPLFYRYPVKSFGDKWPTHNGRLESILALDPDLVIAGEYNAITMRQRLKSLGYEVKVLSLPSNLQELADYQMAFKAMIGLSATSKIASSSAFSEVAHTPLRSLSRQTPVSHAGKVPRLLLLGANGIGKGISTLEHQIIQAAGWQNYLSGQGHIALRLEAMVMQPPDAILATSYGGNALAQSFMKHPVLTELVRAEHWLDMDDWRWQCGGPWTESLIADLLKERQRLFGE